MTPARVTAALVLLGLVVAGGMAGFVLAWGRPDTRIVRAPAKPVVWTGSPAQLERYLRPEQVAPVAPPAEGLTCYRYVRAPRWIIIACYAA